MFFIQSIFLPLRLPFNGRKVESGIVIPKGHPVGSLQVRRCSTRFGVVVLRTFGAHGFSPVAIVVRPLRGQTIPTLNDGNKFYKEQAQRANPDYSYAERQEPKA